MAVNKNPIVWVDLEMTGLEPYQKIVEMAVIVTDFQLNIIARGPDLVIHKPETVLNKMSPWCKKTFKKNGLIDRIRRSKISTKECEMRCLRFIKKYCKRGESPIAGNSIYSDRAFLEREMPNFLGYLHWRIIDVNTVKELVQRWNPELLAAAPVKKYLHRSLDDIEESIKELLYYMENFFRTKKIPPLLDNHPVPVDLSRGISRKTNESRA